MPCNKGGITLARRKDSSAPPAAPNEVSTYKAQKWVRLGKADARKYGALLDVTATHSLIRAASEAQRGQHNVNAWLINQVGPDQTGNERILVGLRKATEEIELLANDRSTSPRVQHQNGLRLGRLEAQVSNLEAQWRANVTKGRGTIQIAEQALETWVRYYSQIAAIYTRARANAGVRDVSSVQAEIPAMESIPLVEVEGFDHDDPPLVRKVRK